MKVPVSEFQKRFERLQKLMKNAKSMEEHLFEHDDRTTAIMATGIIEDLLAISIMHKFRREPSENQIADLFTGYGPLASLSARASLAFLLGIIGHDAAHDIKVIRRVRNEFAHVIEPITFESEEVASPCQSLKLHSKMRPDLEQKAGKGPRGKFIHSVMRIFTEITAHALVTIEENKLLSAHRDEIRGRVNAAIAEQNKRASARLKPTSDKSR
jgi:DNA-binding MltR family transcriptional regulator